MSKVFKAVNWNTKTDDFTQMFWEQNVRQFWVDTEIPVANDILSWNKLTDAEKNTYKKVLGGLTMLDTQQANSGMPNIAEKIEDKQRRAVLYFMGMMEHIHAKSYSTIFTTLLIREDINDVFKWVEENKFIQNKAAIIGSRYERTYGPVDLYLAMVASVFLESFLFYSGFFYPLYLSGKGQMVSSGEIIKLIVRDESIHGVYVGLLAQEIYNSLDNASKGYVDRVTYEMLNELMDNEYEYTQELYDPIGLTEEVNKFCRYNANKALMNLGKESYYPTEEINPIVLNGLNVQSNTHDFFSTKGTGYQKGVVEGISDDDFLF